MALPGPRVVNVRERLLKKTYEQWFRDEDARRLAGGEISRLAKDLEDLRKGWVSGHITGLHSDTAPPNILFVCRESVEVSSKFYERILGRHRSLPAAWFSFLNDTLYLRYDNYFQGKNRMASCLNYLPNVDDRENLGKVQNLALLLCHKDLRSLFLHLEEYLAVDFLWQFEGTKKISLVLQHYGDDLGAPVHLIDPIDFDAAWLNYTMFVGGTHDEGSHDPLEIPTHEYMLAFIWDQDRFAEVCQDEHGPEYKIPEIDFKVALEKEEYKSWVGLQARAKRIMDGDL
jgi:hypothetical protein